MITITIPVLPAIFALVALVGSTLGLAATSEGWLAGITTLGLSILVFLMSHGLFSLLGAY